MTLHIRTEHAFSVTLPEFTFQAKSWSISAKRNYVEKNSVDGAACVGNSGLRMKVLTIQGEIPYITRAKDSVLALDGLLTNRTRFNLEFQGIRYISAFLISYTVSESIEGNLLPCTLTIGCTNALQEGTT